MRSEPLQILVADDEPNMRKVLRAMLEHDGYDVHLAEDGAAALEVLENHHVDVLITDLRMPEIDGMELLKRVHGARESMPVIMITAHGTVDTAVEAIKLGAFDYITKPFEGDELIIAVKRAIEHTRLLRENAVLRTNAEPLRTADGAAGGAAGLGIDVIPCTQASAVEETGATLEENAIIKARHACAISGLPAVGDDTGLFVRGLGGGPGLYTSRYAGPCCTYEDNIRKLLRALTWETGPARSAVFRTAAALCVPGGGETVVTGELEGTIITEPRGVGGFGYDPVFLVESLD